MQTNAQADCCPVLNVLSDVPYLVNENSVTRLQFIKLRL